MTMQVTGAAAEGTRGFMCKRYMDTGNFNAKSEVYSIGVTILQLIAEHCDTRPPCSGAEREAMQKLAAMAAAGHSALCATDHLLPLLRRASGQRGCASAPAEEVSALRASMERMNAELRGLRLQEQAARAQMQQVAQGIWCAASWRLGASDTMLEEHRDRGGTIPCVRHNPMFQPQCSAYYSEQALARALPGEVIFVAYRGLLKMECHGKIGTTAAGYFDS
ncbi:unnamed protein product [Effrenium voratum]|uniref:Protein kinase domain-containing protein n=1 Tax=Effrenium voratum TaxID=2562239 RepID=A0AA36ICT3_9DINO|nr:unnamed protein product [Effrenium voratum]